LTATRSLLIVEDEPQWCGIYSRAANRQGLRTVKIAKNLAQAAELVEKIQFAVAFIDIGLDVADNRNVDGLRVMDKIRSVKDETSIVVVTGRSGADVLPITRDSIIRYHAHNILGKVDITPSDIEEALRTGLELFEKRNSLTSVPARTVLRGDLDPWRWEDQMMRGTCIQRGAQGLYEFLDRLVSEFLPLIPVKPGAAVTEDTETGVMHGIYWSRSIGAPVAICFAAKERAKSYIPSAGSGQFLLGSYDVGPILNEFSAYGVRGSVFALNGVQRSKFA
jgi:ActR/RegA family two-component response regulator